MAVRSAREAAYETIRSRIITMELKPGDELNDHELAQELGISRTPMREALIMLNIAHMVTIKPQSGTYVAPIDLELMEMEQFARFTLEKELLNRIRGRLTGEQERAYRLLIEQYRVLESHPEAENRETRMLDLDNVFHRRAFELCGMEGHFDHMLSTLLYICSADCCCSTISPQPHEAPCAFFTITLRYTARYPCPSTISSFRRA